MSFWKKFKKVAYAGARHAKDVTSLMSLVPGPIGAAALAAMPAATAVSAIAGR